MSADPVSGAQIDLLCELLCESRRLGTLSAAGDIARLSPLSGGSINHVFRVETSSGQKLLYKHHPRAPRGFFQAERIGLETLRATAALTVPAVFAVRESGILMEWLEPAAHGDGIRERRTAEALGRGLAKIHRSTSSRFGFEKDNFTGLLPQANTPCDDWSTFFRDRRLVPQFRLARTRGHMNAERERLSERLTERLDEWIGIDDVAPSLLHGDLWSGNWIATTRGPALIDPAVYYGDREVDLAMARLFGGFSEPFWRAYEEAYPLRDGHAERLPLYQLYYLLIHLNIFGESYGPAVDRVLRRYGG